MNSSATWLHSPMRLAVLVFLSLGASLAVPGRSEAAFPGDNGRIAFTRPDAIWVVNADGTRERRLPDTAGSADPAWSPDGHRVAFTRNPSGAPDDLDIWVMDADGSHQMRLTIDPGADAEPAWSGDGQWIAFVRDSGDIWVRKADGTGIETNLTNAEVGSIGRPAWSPDGSEIAFAGVRDGDGGAPQIYVMNADGTGRRRLTDPVTSSFQFNTDPDWSPDGRQIAFVSGRDSVLSRNPEIYVMDADGGNQTRRTNDTAEDREPAWSPDGRQIAFSSSRDFASDVYLMPSGGGPALPLTTDGESLGETSSPSWQPEPVDDPPTISIDDPVLTEGDTGTKTVTFTLRRSRLAKPLFPDPVTVDWTTESEFAGAGSDFVPASGTATFDPGSLTTTVDVQINGDVLDEYDEIFNLRLSNPHSAAIDEDEGLGLGTVTIVDDDPEPSLSLGDARIVEGDAGTRTLTFTASLSAASGRPVTVDIATADGTATAPSDYTPTSATLTFDPGVTTRTFDVPITTDDAAEPDETFTVTLSHPGNATTSGGDATGTIEDDDGLAAGFTAVPNPASCGAPVSFDASGSTAGPGRSIASYEWDFGDGATGSGKQASHAYNAFGSYTAKLTVTDSTSHTDTRTTTVDQVNRDPVADAGGPYTVRPGTGVTLDASGSRDPNSPCGDSIGSYEWDLDGNGTYGEARGQSRTLTAAELAALGLDTGNHAIAVRVRDLHGGESTDTATLAADGPPLNDDFADAATLAAQGATAFDTSFATFEAGEPGMFSTYGSVWFTIAPGRGVMKLRTQTAFNSPTRDRRVAVYTGPEVGALSPLMIGSAAVDTNTSEVAFATKAGVTYSIQVSAPTGVADPFGAFHNGAGTLTPQFFAAPANDDFADATALGSTASFDTSFATGEPAERFPSPGPASVWFTIAPGRGVERLHAQAARTFERARRVAVYASSGIPGEFDAPVATGSTGLDGAVDVTFSTAAGVTYHVQVSGSVGWDGPSPLPEAIDPGRGAGTISTEFHAAPPNDDFAGATSITPGTPFGSVPFDTSFATLESGELLFGSGTVWFKIAPGHGVLRLRAPGGPFLVQSRLSVYAGSAIDALGPQIADASSTSPGNAEVAFPTSAGTTYHVRVTGPVAFSGLPLGGLALGIGTGTLVHEFHAAPANDDFADAATLAPTGETALDTSFASRETGEALSDAGTASVWFTIAPGRGAVTLRPRRGGSAFPGRVAVFVGTTLDALSPVVVGSIGGDVTFRTGAAVSYRVQVIGPTALAGSEPGTLDPSVGTGTLGYEFRAGPPNDDFADAVALGPGDTAFDTTLGTLEPGELSPFSASVWFTVAPGRGALKLSAVGANGAISTPRVTIYRGSSVGTLEPVASSSQSTVAFPTVAGVTYRIQVASPTAFDGSPLAPNSAPGAGTLSRQFFPAPPNDDFADAAALGAGGSGFDTSYATVEANEGDLTGDPGTVWYRMSPGLGTVSLHAEGTLRFVAAAGRLGLLRHRPRHAHPAEARGGVHVRDRRAVLRHRLRRELCHPSTRPAGVRGRQLPPGDRRGHPDPDRPRRGGTAERRLRRRRGAPARSRRPSGPVVDLCDGASLGARARGQSGRPLDLVPDHAGVREGRALLAGQPPRRLPRDEPHVTGSRAERDDGWRLQLPHPWWQDLPDRTGRRQRDVAGLHPHPGRRRRDPHPRLPQDLHEHSHRAHGGRSGGRHPRACSLAGGGVDDLRHAGRDGADRLDLPRLQGRDQRARAHDPEPPAAAGPAAGHPTPLHPHLLCPRKPRGERAGRIPRRRRGAGLRPGHPDRCQSGSVRRQPKPDREPRPVLPDRRANHARERVDVGRPAHDGGVDPGRPALGSGRGRRLRSQLERQDRGRRIRLRQGRPAPGRHERDGTRDHEEHGLVRGRQHRQAPVPRVPRGQRVPHARRLQALDRRHGADRDRIPQGGRPQRHQEAIGRVRSGRLLVLLQGVVGSLIRPRRARWT